jgi:hypothetical protein
LGSLFFELVITLFIKNILIALVGVKTMKNIILILTVCGLFNSAKATDSFIDSFTEGETNLSFRYRYEFVDQEGFSENAKASTLRTRLNFETAEYNGLSFFIEADNVTHVLIDDFNSGAGTSPDKTNFPVVADPQGTELNQVWINYRFNDFNNIKIGRQKILLDNERFVGGVGFRQNEQTYDALSTTIDISDSELFLAYIDNVNRIFGDDVVAGDHDNSTVLANWSNDFEDIGKLSIYYYDINNIDVSTFSSSTIGARFEGIKNNFNYAIDFARQKDAHNNSVDYSAHYFRLDAGYDFQNATVYTGYEILSGDANNTASMFRTPLATLHKFNGWADKFLATPQDGIKSAFIGVKGSVGGYKWQFDYFDFQAQDSNRDLGSEYDFEVAKDINHNIRLILRAAIYQADTHATDTTKFWFMFYYDF